MQGQYPTKSDKQMDLSSVLAAAVKVRYHNPRKKFTYKQVDIVMAYYLSWQGLFLEAAAFTGNDTGHEKR